MLLLYNCYKLLLYKLLIFIVLLHNMLLGANIVYIFEKFLRLHVLIPNI